MEIRHIRYFLAIAAERSFTRAAERVGIGQPPLSLQIRDLEREVGARLFHRIPQGAELTAAGQAFYDHVHRLPQQIEQAVRAAQRADRGELGALRIGFTASAHFNGTLTSVVGHFSARYPDVELTLDESNTTKLGTALASGALDLAFLRPYPTLSDGVELLTVADEPLVAALPAQHRLARKRGLRLRQLADEAFVLTPREIGFTLHDTILEACRDAGFEARLGQPAPQLASILSLVAAGIGVSLVPDSIRHLHVGGVVFRKLPDLTTSAKLALAWRRSDLSPFVRNFVESARASLASAAATRR
ncbi:LysR family transcriptional regulator [Solimonas marina]|uniref:LysR family transcriptional regulator n=1 Tax=Solimonas marina TaxID=2714601 RepID=A0A969WA49_9GAMM|nr:LysR family transcriptional regulator [Solimonas marina]NKF23591.1 LysR family transcriptional regulator [Solimonas marina]